MNGALPHLFTCSSPGQWVLIDHHQEGKNTRRSLIRFLSNQKITLFTSCAELMIQRDPDKETASAVMNLIDR